VHCQGDIDDHGCITAVAAGGGDLVVLDANVGVKDGAPVDVVDTSGDDDDSGGIEVLDAEGAFWVRAADEVVHGAGLGMRTPGAAAGDDVGTHMDVELVAAENNDEECAGVVASNNRAGDVYDTKVDVKDTSSDVGICASMVAGRGIGGTTGVEETESHDVSDWVRVVMVDAGDGCLSRLGSTARPDLNLPMVETRIHRLSRLGAAACRVLDLQLAETRIPHLRSPRLVACRDSDWPPVETQIRRLLKLGLAGCEDSDPLLIEIQSRRVSSFGPAIIRDSDQSPVETWTRRRWNLGFGLLVARRDAALLPVEIRSTGLSSLWPPAGIASDPPLVETRILSPLSLGSAAPGVSDSSLVMVEACTLRWLRLESAACRDLDLQLVGTQTHHPGGLGAAAGQDSDRPGPSPPTLVTTYCLFASDRAAPTLNSYDLQLLLETGSFLSSHQLVARGRTGQISYAGRLRSSGNSASISTVLRRTVVLEVTRLVILHSEQVNMITLAGWLIILAQSAAFLGIFFKLIVLTYNPYRWYSTHDRDSCWQSLRDFVQFFQLGLVGIFLFIPEAEQTWSLPRYTSVAPMTLKRETSDLLAALSLGEDHHFDPHRVSTNPRPTH